MTPTNFPTGTSLRSDYFGLIIFQSYFVYKRLRGDKGGEERGILPAVLKAEQTG